MDSSDERKRTHEKINFAIQAMTENAQFFLVVAVGIFGILALFVMINHSEKTSDLKTDDTFWLRPLWTKGLGSIIENITLSAAYWALILFGVQSYISRRLFIGLLDKYLEIEYHEYHDDITMIAKENKLAKWTLEKLLSHNQKTIFNQARAFIPCYLIIAFLLWIFVAVF